MQQAFFSVMITCRRYCFWNWTTLLSHESILIWKMFESFKHEYILSDIANSILRYWCMRGHHKNMSTCHLPIHYHPLHTLYYTFPLLYFTPSHCPFYRLGLPNASGGNRGWRGRGRPHEERHRHWITAGWWTWCVPRQTTYHVWYRCLGKWI